MTDPMERYYHLRPVKVEREPGELAASIVGGVLGFVSLVLSLWVTWLVIFGELSWWWVVAVWTVGPTLAAAVAAVASLVVTVATRER